MSSLVFAEQFYYPEGWGGAQLLRDVTTHLALEGSQVVVICGSDQYAPIEGEETDDPRMSGVTIQRAPRLLGGDIHQYKLLRQLVFYAACLPLLFVRRSPDMFVTQTNPPLLVPLVALAALVHRRPFVIIAQDIYPEVMFAHGMSSPSGLTGRILSRVFSWAYRSAERVVALGDLMARRLAVKGVQPDAIEIISNWATGDVGIERGEGNELRNEWGLDGCFVILYSGNIGIAHEVETAVSALAILLESCPMARLVFIGKGSRLVDAERATIAEGVSHAVQFRPLVAADRLPQSLGLASIALVTLREGFEGLVVPSKLLGYMSRGIPTAYVGPHSDVEQMLLLSKGGVCVRNGDAEKLASEIRALIEQPERLRAMGEAAAMHYESQLSRGEGLRKYSALISSVARTRRGGVRRYGANSNNRG